MKKKPVDQNKRGNGGNTTTALIHDIDTITSHHITTLLHDIKQPSHHITSHRKRASKRCWTGGGAPRAIATNAFPIGRGANAAADAALPPPEGVAGPPIDDMDDDIGRNEPAGGRGRDETSHDVPRVVPHSLSRLAVGMMAVSLSPTSRSDRVCARG